MKKAVSLLVLILLLTSLFTVAQADVEEKSSCSGFFGSISCFLWGNPENRAGRGWFEGRALVGEATISRGNIIVGSTTYTRSSNPISYQGRWYYYYTSSTDNENFIFFVPENTQKYHEWEEGNWRQIDVSTPSSPQFVTSYGSKTNNPGEADLSFVLNQNNRDWDDSLFSRLYRRNLDPTLPEGTQYMVRTANDEVVYYKIGTDNKLYRFAPHRRGQDSDWTVSDENSIEDAATKLRGEITDLSSIPSVTAAAPAPPVDAPAAAPLPAAPPAAAPSTSTSATVPPIPSYIITMGTGDSAQDVPLQPGSTIILRETNWINNERQFRVTDRGIIEEFYADNWHDVNLNVLQNAMKPGNVAGDDVEEIIVRFNGNENRYSVTPGQVTAAQAPATPPTAAPTSAPAPAAAPPAPISAEYPVGGEYRDEQGQIVSNLYYGPDGRPVSSSFFIERANPIADNIRPGFTPVNPDTTTTPGGVTTYNYADGSMLHVYPNGESRLVMRDNTRGDIYQIDYGTDGSRHLTLGDGFQNLEGDYNDNDFNQNIVDELHSQGFLTDTQYRDIQGAAIPILGPIGEERMSIVRTMLESNAALRSDLAKPGATADTPAPSAPAPSPATTIVALASPPPPPPAPPQGSQKIEGTDYSLGPDGEFYDQKGGKVNAHQLVQQQRITHDQAYAMLDARAQQSESRVLAGLPGGTQVNYQGNTYRYNSQQRGWQTADGKAAPAGLSVAVAQGQAQVTPTNLLGSTSANSFKIGNQQYTYDNNGWHTGGANGAVISAADLEKKLVDPNAQVSGNPILQERITALNEHRRRIAAAKKARQQADSQMWAGSWFEGIQTSRGYQNIKQYASTAGDIASVMESGGKYRALSNALFGRETSRTWILNADNEFFTTWANLPSYAATHEILGVRLAPQACELDDARRTEIPGSSSQFVQTASGTYQFVGSIQAEKTGQTQPILCTRNEDPEVEAEFTCRTGQVCVDDMFCHADTDGDGDPDSETAVQGYFYKITWGVSAPQDESFTPYIDEDSKAVKFNIQLIAEDGTSIWLYNRAGVTGTGVLALKNGASDRDVKTHFSSKRYAKACIKYDPQYIIKDRDGTEVEDQCEDIIPRDGGSVEFSGSRRTESVTTTSAEVSSNADW